MLRIGIDARPLMYGGAGQYVHTLIHSLLKIDESNRYTIFVSPDVINKKLLGDLSQPNIETVNIKVNSLTLKQHIAFFIYYPRKMLDIYHYPHFDMPLINFNRSVATIYDLYPLVLPGYCSRLKQIYFKEVTRFTVNRSSRVIAISRCTKQDIISHFNIDPRKIVIIYPGVEALYRPLDNEGIKKEILTRYGIKNKFILYVGNAKPHKNLTRLIKAFSNLDRKILDEYQLVFVGNITNEHLKLSQVIKDLGIGKHTVFTGHIPKDDLLQLYNLAALLILVSLYEGFGLPLVEAMACGAPVLASNVAAMPEVVGEAGVLVNPYKVDDIARGIDMILMDLPFREKLRRKSLERAMIFSWRSAAEKTLQVYEEATRGSAK